MRKRIALFSVLTLLIMFMGCGSLVPDTGADLPIPSDGKTLTVSFLDVGQGDSIFIELPHGKTVLIDASESDMSDRIATYIKGRGYSTIDYVVATHPHADHIGGMADVLRQFQIGEIWMPDAPSDTKTYENLLTTVEELEIPLHTATAGKSILSRESLQITLLAPSSDSYSELNDYSAVVSLTYGKTRFLFMGDAEALSEEEIIDSGAPLSADVLKLGHHGSSTSSSEAFLRAVSPMWGIVSCGEGNSYGHPHQETVELAAKLNITLCRTDTEGNIVFTSDGSKVMRPGVDTPEKPATAKPSQTDPPEYNWVLNTSSKKIHRPDCGSVDSISEQNKGYSSKSVSQLEAEGYSPCGACSPAD